MSYDLMVFDVGDATREYRGSMEWYAAQTQWPEPHDYNNPDVPSPSLRAWFGAMIAVFPPMNGPLASEDADDPCVTDYSLGRSCIYAAFRWSKVDEAFGMTTRLAAAHGVGFFNPSCDPPELWFPDGSGRLEQVRG